MLAKLWVDGFAPKPVRLCETLPGTTLWDSTIYTFVDSHLPVVVCRAQVSLA